MDPVADQAGGGRCLVKVGQAMRVKMGMVLLGVGITSQGCAPLWQSARTSVVQPVIYSRAVTETRECHRNHELANAAWGDFNSKHPTVGYSKDFECGFKEGFTDYLYAGGTGAPPPLPPRCYWKFKYETTEGHQAIQDWFAGFRAGAESARDSGVRKLVVVPASTCLPSLTTQTPQLPSPSPTAIPGIAPGVGNPKEELLPPPRKTPSTDNQAPGDSQAIEMLLPPPSRPPETVPPTEETSEAVNLEKPAPLSTSAMPSKSGADTSPARPDGTTAADPP